MKNEIPFSFFLATANDPVTERDDIWRKTLPGSHLSRPGENDPPATYGAYFEVVRQFLEEQLAASHQHLTESFFPEDLTRIAIFLEKHGAFYHPARIHLEAGGATRQLVANVAVGAAGKSIVQREFGVLKRLNREHGTARVPAVYGEGFVETASGCRIGLFLGEWLEGYHEFHITADPENRGRMVVWEPEGPAVLTDAQTESLYRQIAAILTGFYKPETGEQVYPWHHGSGDFVVKRCGESVDLKLITARDYTTLFKTGPAGRERKMDAGETLHALLIFFLHLSIRTRLDRADGVGEIVWSGDAAVPATAEGFFRALGEKNPLPGFSAPLDEVFLAYLNQGFKEPDLQSIAAEIIRMYPDGAPEVPVVEAHLGRHIQDLHHQLCG